MTQTRLLGRTRLLIGIVAVILLALSLVRLESMRAGIDRTELDAGTTPGTLYRQPGSTGPLVVIAHGFAGSRQLMEAFSLTLARDGYRVLAFDFQGHGRNPVPMGGDVTRIDGTTARLVAETGRVIDAGIAATGWTGPIALVGHSMATDVIIRAALDDPRIGPIVAVSAFSGAVTATAPPDLLFITGQWETALRAEALRAVRLTDPAAAEDQTITANPVNSGPVIRRAQVAPHVEHVSVLYSTTTLSQTRDWLDRAYGRSPTPGPVAATGGWIALMLGCIVALAWPLAGLLPASAPTPAAATSIPAPIPARLFWICVVAPLVAAPLIATQIRVQILPVLVADYLALHLFLYGAIQLALLVRAGVPLGRFRVLPFAALLLFGLGAFGLALDRYVASFMASGLRLQVLAGVALGAVPFMLADSLLTSAGQAAFWRRMVLRLGFLVSLVAAVALDFERLMFLVIILPVIVLFFVVFGLMGRWVGQRSGAMPTGLALGLILAWSLASAFPLFAP